MLKHARFVARRDWWRVGNALLLVVLGIRIGGSLKTCWMRFQAAFVFGNCCGSLKMLAR